jgi:hypothetical protein
MRRGLGSIVTVILVLGLTPTAQGDPVRHCVSWLEPLGPPGPSGVIHARPVDLGCYETFARAIEVASDGAIHLPASATPAQLSDQMLRQATEPDAADSVIIGTEWGGTSYAGASHSYPAASTCSASVSWDLSYVTDAWNDRFSSGKGFGGCDVNRKFAASNFGGASKLCTPNCTNYGAGVADEVSSLIWQH